MVRPSHVWWHFVMTFSVNDHHDSHERSAVRVSGSKKQNEHSFSLCLTDNQSSQSETECPFCCLGLHAKYIPRMSWSSPTENVMTKWVIKSWVLNKMSPNMWLVTKHVNRLRTVTSDHLSCVRELTWTSFVSWVLVTVTVAFGSTVHSQNKSWLCLRRY